MSDLDLSKMFEPEDLHPELAPYLFDMGHGMQMLQHPLVYDVPHFSLSNKMNNLRLKANQAQLAEALAEKNWIRAIFTHERPYRTQMLHEYIDHIDDPKLYWGLVGRVWIDSDNVWQNLDMWTDMWSFYHPEHRAHVMDEDEQAALQALPDRVTIYRGVTNYAHRKGLAWTLDRERAERFAKGNNSKTDRPCVLVGEIQKDEILAHFLGRDESEIVAMYEDVKNIRRA